MKLSEVKIGKIFKVAGIEFIKFSEDGDKTVVVAKDCVFNSQFGANNNFAQSSILKRLKDKILPKLEAAVGAENILEHEVDLTSLDGLKTYGSITSKISIPTFDFYRDNVSIFDEHKYDGWWWLATPDTTPEHYNDRWCRCVSPDGCIGDDSYNFNVGVRPFCIFESSISVSCEK